MQKRRAQSHKGRAATAAVCTGARGKDMWLEQGVIVQKRGGEAFILVVLARAPFLFSSRCPAKPTPHSSSTAGVFIESSTEALRMINWCAAVCLGSIKAGACVPALLLSGRLMQASVLQPN